jgi:uncharacterized protein involved in exopolysaccharide biosynthesis
MRTITILFVFLILGLTAGWLVWFLLPQVRPEYTAEVFIRVLPGTEKNSAAALIKNKNTLTLFTDRDKIQQTGWFQGLGNNKDERLKAGLSELKKRLHVKSMRGADLIRISMTCSNANDAALIVNESAAVFLNTQAGERRKQIASNLMFLDDYQARIQRDLESAERTLDDIRRRYGFADLEQHDYLHPITVRLIRLQKDEDNCVLDVNKLQTHRDFLEQSQKTPSGKPDPNSNAEIKNVELKIKMAQSRLTELGKMRESAEKKQDELDIARAQYAQRQFIRDDRRKALDSIRAKIEELKMLHDNPDASGLQSVDLAGIPLEADSLRWQTPVWAGAAGGLLTGIICAFLTGKKGEQNKQAA